MAKLKRLKLSILFCLFLIQFSSFFHSSEAQATYSLPEQFFINCGSSSSSVTYGNRAFIGDGNSGNLTVTPTTSSPVDDTTNSSSIELYRTARFSRNPLSYDFNIVENGTYVVRFHFYPFSSSSSGNLSDARFSVSASGITLLSGFSIRNSARIEEFLMIISPGRFRVDFSPNGNSFAFVNAIEVFIAPSELLSVYHNNSSSPLRVIHRINVGGGDLTPQNDTLLRSWVSDDAYLLDSSLASDSPLFNGTISYQDSNLTVFDAPIAVYSTAKVMNTSSSNSLFNVTWRFDVRRGGITHLVRAHFCSILNGNMNGLSYNLYIGSNFSQDINPWARGNSQFQVPFFIDILSDSDDSGFMNISIGPPSNAGDGNTFLNGVEIMELVVQSTSSSPGGNGSGGGSRTLPIIIGCVVGVVVSILIGVLFYCFKKGKWKNAEVLDHWPLVSVFGGSTHSKTTISISGSPLLDLNLGLKVSFSEIGYATNGFDPKLVIGEGGFGKVYKGTLRNGTKVAVKRSEPGHGQGFSEFQAEVMLLSRIRHNHLVALVGYCDERDEMILVYEFMDKGTLREHLYTEGDRTTESTTMAELSWLERLQICIGAARGIHYLHTGQNGAIIHRDIKSTNILLDEHNVAKVADFGLSRLGPVEDSQETHVSTVVKGSFGYLDPEYFRCLQLTLKSDVYSFGVVLLEVVCARSALDNTLPRDQINLADWGLSFQTKGELEKIIDPSLVGKINPGSMRKFGELVEKCLQESGADRPSMADVLWDLEYCLQLQNAPKPRAAYEDSMMDASSGLPMHVFDRLPSDSVTMSGFNLPDDSFAYSDVSQINDSGVFSQLKLGAPR